MSDHQKLSPNAPNTVKRKDYSRPEIAMIIPAKTWLGGDSFPSFSMSSLWDKIFIDTQITDRMKKIR